MAHRFDAVACAAEMEILRGEYGRGLDLLRNAVIHLGRGSLFSAGQETPGSDDDAMRLMVWLMGEIKVEHAFMFGGGAPGPVPTRLLNRRLN